MKSPMIQRLNKIYKYNKFKTILIYYYMFKYILNKNFNTLCAIMFI